MMQNDDIATLVDGGFLPYRAEKLIKVNITEYKRETDIYTAVWRIEVPSEGNPTRDGEIKLKDRSSFTVFGRNAFKHFLFVIAQLEEGETDFDHIRTLWREARKKLRSGS